MENRLAVRPVKHGNDFFALLDSMIQVRGTKRGGIEFSDNKRTILDGMMNGRLYSVCLKDSDSQGIPCKISDYIELEKWLEKNEIGESRFLRCFVLLSDMDDKKVDLIWVHPKIRRKKIGTFLVKQLGIESVGTEMSEEGKRFFYEFGITSQEKRLKCCEKCGKQL